MPNTAGNILLEIISKCHLYNKKWVYVLDKTDAFNILPNGNL